MTQPSDTPPIRFEQTQQSKMARAVLQELRGHRLVVPLRESGRSQIDRPVVGCHTPAIWASFGSLGRGEYRLEARVEVPEWWEPELLTFEDYAKRLAGFLAFELRRQWEAEHSHRGD